MLIFLTFSCANIYGQKVKHIKLDFYINYQNDDNSILLEYSKNHIHLDSLGRVLDEVLCNPKVILNSIEISSHCSLPGSYFYNEQLAHRRSGAILNYLESYYEIPKSKIIVNDGIFGWDSLNEVLQNSKIRFKEEILETLELPEKIYDDKNRWVDGRKRRLGLLKGGNPYRDILNHYSMAMRNTHIIVNYDKMLQNPEVLDNELLKEINLIDKKTTKKTLEIFPRKENRIESRKPLYVAATTNLLHDALVVPNLGFEIYLGKNYTLNGTWSYIWNKNDRTHKYWRIYGGDIGVRKYFGALSKVKPLQGSHVGLYLGILTYDVENGGTGYLGNKWSKYFGVSYGYNLPVGKRINLDFTLGLGCMFGKYKVYEPIDNCYVWQKTKNRMWVGPTKAEIKLVWLWGYNNINR